MSDHGEQLASDLLRPPAISFVPCESLILRYKSANEFTLSKSPEFLLQLRALSRLRLARRPFLFIQPKVVPRMLLRGAVVSVFRSEPHLYEPKSSVLL